MELFVQHPTGDVQNVPQHLKNFLLNQNGISLL